MNDRVRVLLVDDQPDVRLLLRITFETAGMEVCGEAASAERVLPAVAECDPHVVVLDAMMPVTDGYEVAASLSSQKPGLPIILCSAFVDDRVEKAAREAGCAAVVPKDDLDRLPDRVLSVLGR
jgi:CheY-like chemotaxis protein